RDVSFERFFRERGWGRAGAAWRTILIAIGGAAVEAGGGGGGLARGGGAGGPPAPGGGRGGGGAPFVGGGAGVRVAVGVVARGDHPGSDRARGDEVAYRVIPRPTALRLGVP